MRGHLQQRSAGSWRLKVFVGRLDDGRKRYIERTVRGTRRDAERALARLIVEVDEGRHVAAAPMTFNELVEQWLEVKAGTVEASTFKNYEWAHRTYIAPAIGDRKLTTIRVLELDRLYRSLHEGGLAPRTVRLCHTV